MNLLPATFWGGWAAGIVIIGFIGLFWLALGVYKDRNAHSPEQAWDDNLREGNSPPPKWWFFTLFAFLIFSIVYMMLYPALGNNKGFLEWNQYRQLSDGLAYYQKRTAQTHQHWENTPFAELREDKSAMQSAQRLFADNCAACHAEDGDGQAGLFPSLIDNEWQWGGSDEQILHSIRNGRIAAMPAWEAAFTETQLQSLTDYIIALNDGSASDDHAGQPLYAANCAACHGKQAEGNEALGAPRFINHRWVYTENGDVRAGVEKSIRLGRNGIMPAQQKRLTAAQTRLLAAWLGKDDG